MPAPDHNPGSYSISAISTCSSVTECRLCVVGRGGKVRLATSQVSCSVTPCLQLKAKAVNLNSPPPQTTLFSHDVLLPASGCFLAEYTSIQRFATILLGFKMLND
ncbi:hypothetical protein MTP99_001566 [Tenebrio molitor]|nr:hypothetical protein MTP99_001566 [Tenebrio molitor]